MPQLFPHIRSHPDSAGLWTNWDFCIQRHWHVVCYHQHCRRQRGCLSPALPCTIVRITCQSTSELLFLSLRLRPAPTLEECRHLVKINGEDRIKLLNYIWWWQTKQFNFARVANRVRGALSSPLTWCLLFLDVFFILSIFCVMGNCLRKLFKSVWVKDFTCEL